MGTAHTHERWNHSYSFVDFRVFCHHAPCASNTALDTVITKAYSRINRLTQPWTYSKFCVFLRQPIRNLVGPYKDGARNLDHNGQCNLDFWIRISRMKMRHCLTIIPCILSIGLLNHYCKLIYVLLPYTAVGVQHCPSSIRQIHLQRFSVPGMRIVTYFWPASTCFDSVKADSSLLELNSLYFVAICRLFHGILQWLQALSFLDIQRGTTQNHGSFKETSCPLYNQNNGLRWVENAINT